MAGRCIVFDRRSDPMVMESRIVSAPFPISSVTDLSRLAYISLSLFRHDVCCTSILILAFYIASIEKEKMFPSFENDIFFFLWVPFFFYVLFYRGRWKLWNSRWKNVMCSVLSTSKRERRQEICGGDGGGNVTPRLHGPRQGDSNFRVHVGSVKRRAARFAST